MKRLLQRAAFMACWLLLVAAIAGTGVAQDAKPAAPVDVYLWFDTEDYILPQADDAAKRIADLLSGLEIQGTFKLVGEKARVLERRGRHDVIEALKRHDIGFHTNYHSVQPTPALYLSRLGWDEGVREFLRREGPGVKDVARIFGTMPSCYGQPGSSWGPQQYGAMRHWGIRVYLDAGRHVQLNGEPFWYCGILHLYALRATTRTGLHNAEQLEQAKRRFEEYYRELRRGGGGPVSIVYHPCEFVHEKFWDGVNFSRGANPPREQWKLPPMKSTDQIETAFRIFEAYVRFIRDHQDVRFVTARDAERLYPDLALGRTYDTIALAKNLLEHGVRWQVLDERYSLSAAEVLLLLADAYCQRLDGAEQPRPKLTFSPLGPTASPPSHQKVTSSGSQFNRTVRDVLAYVRYHRRVPAAVWLGSEPVAPEAFLVTLARFVAHETVAGSAEQVVIEPAELDAARYVADDEPGLWDWVIFPPEFRAPELMRLAKLQAWTLKPALRVGSLHPAR